VAATRSVKVVSRDDPTATPAGNVARTKLIPHVSGAACEYTPILSISTMPVFWDWNLAVAL
jgi:hypothetical protein